MEKIVGSQPEFTYEIYITHALIPPWKEILEQGQMLTWASTRNQRVRHVYARPIGPLLQPIDRFYWKLRWSRLPGTVIMLFEVLLSRIVRLLIPKTINPQNSYTKQDVLINMPDLFILSNVKSLAIHRTAAASTKDFVVLTTTSSYINEKLLQRELERLPREKVIGGRVVLSREKKFMSGSFRLYTPDVLFEAMQNLKMYRTWLAEDLAMGHLMNQIGVNFTSLKSLDIGSISELESLTDNILKETVHFRVTSGSLLKRNDVTIMLALHKKLQELDAI
jgi:hypothetical protein